MFRDRKQKGSLRRAADGRLLARPGRLATAAEAGRHRLRLEEGRDGLLYVPVTYSVEKPAPLVLLLHGAGGDAQHGLSLMRNFADEEGLLLLAPDSRRQTWDVIVDNYGPDVAFIDRALEQTFSRYAVDAARIVVAGFSDGASYALSLGITNGDLFTHIIAFSPGFLAPAAQNGSPDIYISHGTQDRVLPVEQCSRRIAPRLRAAGYEVFYREFDGPHFVPPEIAREALDRLSAGQAQQMTFEQT